MFGADAYGVELTVDSADTERLLAVEPSDVAAAPELTFARNVFIPLTTACRYTCTYCTYYDPPGSATLLSPEEIEEICERGAEAGCTEALFTFGDDPDGRYTEIYDQLEELGHDSIHSYLREACEIALECGLLPHSNPGDQTHEQMELVADLNASMGVMLETTADVQSHGGPRSKDAGQRIATIATPSPSPSATPDSGVESVIVSPAASSAWDSSAFIDPERSSCWVSRRPAWAS